MYLLYQYISSSENNVGEQGQLQQHPLFQEAMTCLMSVYFEGVLSRVRRLEMAEAGMREACQHIAWLAGVYLGGSSQPDPKETQAVLSLLSKLPGGQGLAELSLVAAENGQLDKAAKGIHNTLKTAMMQHGVHITWHPVAILRLQSHSDNLQPQG